MVTTLLTVTATQVLHKKYLAANEITFCIYKVTTEI